MLKLSTLLVQFLIITLSFFRSEAGVVQLTSDNLDVLLKSNKLIFINFYADWCRFSRMLAPIFSDASDLVGKEFNESDVIFGRVDCDAEQAIAQRYGVNKYPTMKLFRFGNMIKREYRGQRTAESLASYIRDQLKDPVSEVHNLDEIYELKRDKRVIVGYFESKESIPYKNFDDVAKLLKDDCSFYAAIGELSKPERTSGDNVIFRPIGEENAEMVYLGSLANKELFQAWTQDKCVPLVREITFQNGEELTEEGLPFLILFHSKEDTESLEAYTKEVSQLVSYKSVVNFLVADCETFSHPLHHLGKKTSDCPLVAIDSFRHMYLFEDFSKINEPGKLKQFILDLQSGKLHKDFHHAPEPKEVKTTGQLKMDRMILVNSGNVFYKATVYVENGQVQVQMEPVVETEQPKEQVIQLEQKAADINDKIENVKEVQKRDVVEETSAPSPKSTTIKSIFANLKPSEHRYTIVNYARDEL